MTGNNAPSLGGVMTRQHEVSSELRYMVVGEAPNHESAASEATLAASVLQAPGFRSDATVFRLNAADAGESGSEICI